ncbi:Uncharacterized protein TCM_035719 [Theobroma cacao]|uniref:UBN2 domain-containing protein n=1 Tax=Theobroma cacao TaxID=3641 RepID=A0A061FJI2_THECC|nr:Uncharacterized protein TCM_035719 [Theobroma cacao]
MKEGEIINQMYERFTNIVRGLKALRKDFLNAQSVKKILYSFPKSWKLKVTAIEEARDLNYINLKELVGSLLIYEMTLKHESALHDEKKKDIKKKEIALKSIIKENERNIRDKSEVDKDVAMLAKRISKFMKRNYKGRRPHRKDMLKGEHKKDHLICYECRKLRYTKYECPNKKSTSKNFKKKAMVATWSDSDDSQNEEEKVANLYFMALEDSKVCLLSMTLAHVL